jgi:thiosulfate reductase cytochrome b subunit
MSSTKLYLYTRFERFWHWAQAVLIIVLLVTGFEVHGSFSLLGFGTAVEAHNFCAWTWLVLYAFIVFWIITTGEWRHYVPTFVKMFEVIQYYVSGIFKGEAHPVPKSQRTKHNPLQRITYLGIVSVLVPFQIVTGFMYYVYNDWLAFGLVLNLSTIAILHTVGAFAMLAFSVVHVYMTTTGHHPLSHIKAMFTGYEELETKEEL